ncbi:Vitamin B12 transporter BtuB [Pseudomonas carbonaria]|uniref:Vitamin B12 transporter BtuB n=2 Tax=Zestomonas carbonaria TaxID=2762745 RepID=A0A7U7ENU3_9GAMM|nr:Vitamin B12 transporter BtuB [Pseudomonas carbonaria]
MGGAVQAEEGVDPRLATVVVTGNKASEAEQARAELDKVAGSVRVIDNKEVERGRAQNAEDVLAYQPGVFAQATSGTGANKISIRGSGLNTFYQGYVMGIKFLYDGMPISGPGGTQEDMLNMAAVDYTEVLYGANAFAHTALSLGGAINFVTHTGYTSPGARVRLDVGSFGYRKQELSYGGVSGDSDYFVAVLHNERDGFQDDTPNRGKDFIANFGHAFSPKLDTRLIVRYREEKLLNGSTLTKEQIEHDPTHNRLLSDRRKNGTTLISSKTTYTFDDDSKLEVGLGYNNYPLHNGWRYAATAQDWHSTDLNTVIRYLRTGDRLFGLPSDTTLTFSDTRLIDGDVTGYRQSDWVKVRHTDYTGSRDTVFALGNELQLDDQYWLSTGLSLINIDRTARIQYSITPNTSTFPDNVSYNDWHVAPRIGLRYQLSPEVQLFGNVSRSIDPPVTWQHGSTANPYLRPLDPQKGTTVEFGVRGSAGIFDGSLAIYRSWITDELLTVVISPATPTSDAVTANANASDTIHQGIEAGLDTRLWESSRGDSIVLRQAYTFNDFYYRNDDEFGDNELPSLPRHYYQAELQYRHSQGFYAGISVRSASSYYVDYANTLKAPSYTIWGAKVGYDDPGERWSVYLDARNLTDENYVTAANTAYDLKGVDSPNFYAGDGFGVYAGVSYRFE